MERVVSPFVVRDFYPHQHVLWQRHGFVLENFTWWSVIGKIWTLVHFSISCDPRSMLAISHRPLRNLDPAFKTPVESWWRSNGLEAIVWQFSRAPLTILCLECVWGALMAKSREGLPSLVLWTKKLGDSAPSDLFATLGEDIWRITRCRNPGHQIWPLNRRSTVMKLL